tara:strand:- start:800 stop:1102 length:303 start_codon:yes stop_codon:yes gene_type:complete
MKAFLSIILVTILQIPLISGIVHTLEDNHYVCEDQTVHIHELQNECEICFLSNATFVFHSDVSETTLIVFDQIYLTNLNKLSEKLYISTNSSRAPPSVRV